MQSIPSLSATKAFYCQRGRLLKVHRDFDQIKSDYKVGKVAIYHVVVDLIMPGDHILKYHHVGVMCTRTQTWKAANERMSKHVSNLRNGEGSYEQLCEPHLLGAAKEACITAELLQLIDPSEGRDAFEAAERRHGLVGQAEYGSACLTNHGKRRTKG